MRSIGKQANCAGNPRRASCHGLLFRLLTAAATGFQAKTKTGKE
jgi:hypothetical protein